MATISRSSPTPTAGPRVALAFAGLLVIVASVWFAASWVDTGTDSTCGSVLKPNVWVDDFAPATCSPVMPIRAGIAVASIAVGMALLYTAASRRHSVTGKTATLVLTAVAVGVAILLLINESVRSDGAL